MPKEQSPYGRRDYIKNTDPKNNWDCYERDEKYVKNKTPTRSRPVG